MGKRHSFEACLVAGARIGAQEVFWISRNAMLHGDSFSKSAMGQIFPPTFCLHFNGFYHNIFIHVYNVV
jgi:hypothetical protein